VAGDYENVELNVFIVTDGDGDVCLENVEDVSSAVVDVTLDECTGTIGVGELLDAPVLEE